MLCPAAGRLPVRSLGLEGCGKPALDLSLPRGRSPTRSAPQPHHGIERSCLPRLPTLSGDGVQLRINPLDPVKSSKSHLKFVWLYKFSEGPLSVWVPLPLKYSCDNSLLPSKQVQVTKMISFFSVFSVVFCERIGVSDLPPTCSLTSRCTNTFFW